MGEKVASDGVTIVDDGTIDNRRGSLTIDDEGTPTERTVLIENGILKNFYARQAQCKINENKNLLGLEEEKIIDILFCQE